MRTLSRREQESANSRRQPILFSGIRFQQFVIPYSTRSVPALSGQVSADFFVGAKPSLFEVLWLCADAKQKDPVTKVLRDFRGHEFPSRRVVIGVQQQNDLSESLSEIISHLCKAF